MPQMRSNPVLAAVPFGNWTLRDGAAQGRSPSLVKGHMRLCQFLVVVAVLAGCGVSKPSPHELERVLLQQEPQFSAVIDKIEKYRAEIGYYPSDLQTVIDVAFPSVDLPSQFKTLRSAPAHYEVARDRSFFRVTYGVSDTEDYEIHASSSYLSFENRWKVGRHVEHFPHVEAQFFGARYQQDHSSESLSLTFSSLLEAAKANSAYPCRNLWADWIEKALGTGEPQYLGSPALPVVGETKFYATRDNKAAYAVMIDRKIFNPMKTPLPFVVGIYEWRKGNATWTVVQRCDSSASPLTQSTPRFALWTLRNEAAQRRLALRYA